MANITPETTAIAEAVYGEEVRSSIIAALNKINAALNSAISQELNSLAFKGDLDETKDLNTIDPGIYRILPSKQPANMPGNDVYSNQQRLLIYYRSTGGRQELYTLLTGEKFITSYYVRGMSGGTWGSWFKNEPLALKTAIASGTDLNTITNTGIYRVYGDSIDFQNLPANDRYFSNNRLLYVYNIDEISSVGAVPVIKQELHYLHSDTTCIGRYMTRLKIGATGTWDDWVDNIDNTLTVNGVAADAQAVGYYLDEVRDNVKRHWDYMQNMFPNKTVSGTSIIISDGANEVPVRELKVTVTPSQTGTGDPSPSNIRPFTTVSECTVEMTGNTSHEVLSLESGTILDIEPGIAAGGIFDFNEGLFEHTYEILTLDGSENWRTSGASTSLRYTLFWTDIGVANHRPLETLCSHAMFLTGNSGPWGTINLTDSFIAFHNGDGVIADLAAFKQYLADQKTAGTPVQIVVAYNEPSAQNYVLSQFSLDDFLTYEEESTVTAEGHEIEMTYLTSLAQEESDFETQVKNHLITTYNNLKAIIDPDSPMIAVLDQAILDAANLG